MLKLVNKIDTLNSVLDVANSLVKEINRDKEMLNRYYLEKDIETLIKMSNKNIQQIIYKNIEVMNNIMNLGTEQNDE